MGLTSKPVCLGTGDYSLYLSTLDLDLWVGLELTAPTCRNQVSHNLPMMSAFSPHISIWHLLAVDGSHSLADPLPIIPSAFDPALRGLGQAAIPPTHTYNTVPNLASFQGIGAGGTVPSQGIVHQILLPSEWCYFGDILEMLADSWQLPRGAGLQLKENGHCHSKLPCNLQCPHMSWKRPAEGHLPRDPSNLEPTLSAMFCTCYSLLPKAIWKDALFSLFHSFLSCTLLGRGGSVGLGNKPRWIFLQHCGYKNHVKVHT